MQTSYCTHLSYEHVLQTVFSMGTGMNVTALSRSFPRPPADLLILHGEVHAEALRDRGTYNGLAVDAGE